MSPETIDRTDPSTFIAAVPAEWDGRSYNWLQDDRIKALHENRRNGIENTDVTRDEAITLLQEQFGCAYQSLTEDLRSDEELLMLAAVQSAGHAMRSAPQRVIENLSPEWWIEAANRGVRGWVLSFAPDAIRDCDDVVKACVANCGDAIGYASERLRRDHDVQRIAVANNDIAIDRCVDPPADLVASVRKKSDADSPSAHA